MLVKPQVSTPGLYIREVATPPTGIAAIPTAVTAFVGRTMSGPVDTPSMVTSMADFQRMFGGLWIKSPMTYAVQDFFNNGGAQALIVRVFGWPTDKDNAPSWIRADTSDPADLKKSFQGIATIAVNSTPLTDVPDSTPPPVGPPPPTTPLPPASEGVLVLQAASPGAWGNYLKVRFDSQNITTETLNALGFKPGELFNMTVTYNPPWGNGQTERFTNVSVRADAGERRIDRVLENASMLVAYPWPRAPAPAPNSDDMAKVVAEHDKHAKDADWQITNLPTGTGGSDGVFLTQAHYYTSPELMAAQRGLYALDKADIFNVLCIPRDQWGRDNDVDCAGILQYCVRKRAFWILDPKASPSSWDTTILGGQPPDNLITEYIGGALTTAARNAAVFYPDVYVTDPTTGRRMTNPDKGFDQNVGPCGFVAGVFARTDATRGVWKAPAGLTDGALAGVQEPVVLLDNDKNGAANLVGINCLRSFNGVGTVVWGSRTLYGAESLQDEYKYIPVRRLTMYIEESLYRGLQWAVFEPNAEALWSAIRASVTMFLNGLMLQGAFQGSTQKDSFFVQCDATTNSPDDINKGICNVVVGIAPVKPAEFIVLYIQQMTAESQGS